MTDQIFILYFHFNLIYWGYLFWRQDHFFRFLYFFSDLAQLEWALANWLQNICSLFREKQAFSIIFRLCNSWRNILHFFKGYVKIFLDKGVKPVFYFVLRSTGEILADFRPFASYLTVKLKDFLVLLFRPLFFFDSGVQLVDESLPDLLSIFWAQHLREQFPVFSILFNQFADSLVFLRWPNLMTFTLLGESPISMQALVLISLVHVWSYLCPFFRVSLIEL